MKKFRNRRGSLTIQVTTISPEGTRFVYTLNPKIGNALHLGTMSRDTGIEILVDRQAKP